MEDPHERARMNALEIEIRRLQAAIKVLAKLQVRPQLDDILEALDPNHIREKKPYG